MKKLTIMALLLAVLSSCTTIEYVKVKVPYLPSFSCPPIIKPEIKKYEPGMSRKEAELVEEYNLQAAIRYRKSLTNYILCIRRNLKSIKAEAARMEKALEDKTK
jgi:hypothetical protein